MSVSYLFHLQYLVFFSALSAVLSAPYRRDRFQYSVFRVLTGIISFEAGRLNFVFTFFFVTVLVAVWRFRLPNTIGYRIRSVSAETTSFFGRVAFLFPFSHIKVVLSGYVPLLEGDIPFVKLHSTCARDVSITYSLQM